MEGQPDAAAANKAVPVDTLLSMLNAAFSQFLSPEIVGKTILAAGRAAGLDDATLRAKLYAMGAVVKDEADKEKKGKAKKAKGEKSGKGFSLYALFLTKHCAEARAENAKHPLGPGEKRDGNLLKDAISAWSALDKDKFEKLYGELVRDLKARQQLGERLDVAAEVANFEKAKGIAPTAFLAAKRLPDDEAAAKPAKKPKTEQPSDDEDEDEEDDDTSAAAGAATAAVAVAAAVNGKKNEPDESGESDEDESDQESEQEPVAKQEPTPSKVKKPAAKPAAKPAKVKEPVKSKMPEGKVEKKKEKKDKKK